MNKLPLNIPVIIIGPPRTGTSNTARVVYEYFGVKMAGHHFRNELNPLGFYEDIDLVAADSQFLGGHITEDEWKRQFEEFVTKMRSYGVAWGFKDPRQCMFFDKVLERFPDATVIRCKRNRDLVLKSIPKSMDNFAGMTDPEEIYNTCNENLDKFLDGKRNVCIRYGANRYEDSEVANWIADGLWGDLWRSRSSM